MRKLWLSLFFSALTILLTLSSATSFAQYGRRTTKPLPPSTSSSDEGSYSYSSSASRMAASGAFGFYSGGGNLLYGKVGNADAATTASLSGFFGLGGDFDYMLKDDTSIGAVFRYYTTGDSFGGTEFKNNVLLIGGMMKGYFTTSNWLIPFGAGLTIISPSGKSGPNDVSIDMGFGPMFTWGFLYKLSPTLAIGIENLNVLGLGDKINGWIVSDYMLKARISL